jgi:twitching motility protein PilT
VVVLGDIADAATIDTALKAVETGRLVVGTMATPDVVTTVERVVGTLPPSEREVGRMRFAEEVRAVVSQQLLPKKDDDGRVAAVEVLVASPAVRECLKDPERVSQIKRLMAEGRKDLGTQTFDQHLEELIESGQITADTQRAALATAGNAFAGKRPKRAASS